MARKKVISKTVTKATQYEYGYEAKNPQTVMEPQGAPEAVQVRQAVRRQPNEEKGGWNPFKRKKKKFDVGRAASKELSEEADALAKLYGGK